MSIKSLCRQECANYSNGKCLGIIIDKNLSQIINDELASKPCCVDSRRCQYFESIIIPLVRTNKKHPNHKQMTKAIKLYETKYFEEKLVRHCRECGEPVPEMKSNQKYCYKCAAKRKKLSKRNYNRLKRRKSA